MGVSGSLQDPFAQPEAEETVHKDVLEVVMSRGSEQDPERKAAAETEG